MKNSFIPYFDKIQIKPFKVERSILTEETLQEKGEVISIGKDCKFVKVGDIVFYQAYGYLETPADENGEKFYVVPETSAFILGKIGKTSNVRRKK